MNSLLNGFNSLIKNYAILAIDTIAQYFNASYWRGVTG